MGICVIAFPALLHGTSLLAKARPVRKLYGSSAFKDSNFNIFTACSVATFLGYIVPYCLLLHGNLHPKGNLAQRGNQEKVFYSNRLGPYRELNPVVVKLNATVLDQILVSNSNTYFYTSLFAQDVLGISETFALYILVMGISASFFDRLAAGVIAHSIGPLLC